MKKIAVLLVLVVVTALGLTGCTDVNNLEYALVWEEPFEQFSPAAAGWQTGKLGGKQALMYEASADKKVIELELPVQVDHGRLEFAAYQSSENASNFGIKPYTKNDPVFVDFWLSKGGEARLWRGLDPENPNDVYDNGNWHEFAFEWDVSEGTFTAFAKVDGSWTEKFSTTGIAFPPSRLYLDGGGDGSGGIANLKLYDLSIEAE